MGVEKWWMECDKAGLNTLPDTPPVGKKKVFLDFFWNCLIRSTCQWGSIWAITRHFGLIS